VKIAAFGPDGPFTLLSGTVIFGDTQAEDDWAFEMPPVVSQVGGAHGVYDYYDDAIYPISPTTVTKRYVLTGTYTDIKTSWTGIVRDIMTLQRSKLWGLPRGGISGDEIWAYAKLIRARAIEQAGRGQLAWPVELTFLCPEGIWYEKDLDTDQITSNVVGRALYNGGDLPALVKATLTATGTKINQVVRTNTSSSTSITRDDTGGSGVSPGTSLIINSEAYSVLNNGVDAYNKFSIGSGQVAWFVLRALTGAGLNSINVTVTQDAGPPTPSWVLDLEWKVPYAMR